jgi:hypothetical protein
VVLDAEYGVLEVFHAFDGLVVQIDMGDVRFAGVELGGVDCDSVVLRGDFDFAGNLVERGLVSSAVAELITRVQRGCRRSHLFAPSVYPIPLSHFALFGWYFAPGLPQAYNRFSREGRGFGFVNEAGAVIREI